VKEISLKPTTQTTAGIRTSNFLNAVLFLTDVLRLEMIHYDQEKEVARFRLPSAQILEVFGSKNIWHPFTNPPDWEVIVADIRHRKEESRS
jgi:hypothetical protein